MYIIRSGRGECHISRTPAPDTPSVDLATIEATIVQLGERLLSVAGASVLVPALPDDLPAILARGRSWSIGVDAKLRMMPGAPSQCHFNASRWWEANQHIAHRIAICTGYALIFGADGHLSGQWKEHSWGLWKRPRAGHTIVETTLERAIYFGFELTPAEAWEFASNNE